MSNTPPTKPSLSYDLIVSGKAEKAIEGAYGARLRRPFTKGGELGWEISIPGFTEALVKAILQSLTFTRIYLDSETPTTEEKE